MYKIGYLIVTYERPRCIEEFLDKVVPEINDVGNISVYIADGSKGTDTKRIAEKYKYDNVFYVYRPDLSLNERVELLLNTCDCEYICIAGDSRRILKSALKRVIKLMDKGFSIIQTIGQPQPYISNDDIVEEYFDIQSFYNDHAQETITISTTYIKKDDYMKRSDSYRRLSNEGNAFSQVVFYFTCFSGDAFSACFAPIESQKDELKGKPSSEWATSEKMFKVWWHDLLEVVRSLPDEYEDVRFAICSVYSNGLNLDKKSGFLYWRMKGLFEEREIREKKTEINLMSNLPYSKILNISRVSPMRAYFRYCFFKPKLFPHFFFKLLPEPTQNYIKRLLKR